nr:DUF4347 domain-containing protein [Plesiomonas shigelloides]
MLWRQFFKKQAQPVAISETAVQPFVCGYVLEARMLFDGAIAATVEQTTDTHTTEPQTASTTAHTTSAETASQSDSSSHAGQDAGNQSSATKNTSTDSHSTDSNSTTSTASNGSDVAAVAGATVHKEVVFIDTSVAGYQTLVANVPAGMEVVLLDGSKDGLTQMAVWAQTHSGYDAIHVLSHGSEGAAQLGTLTLNSATAQARANNLATLGAALNADGDLLLYGCDVAQASGQQFASLLAQLTSADVAASTNPTGAAALGGDWVTECHTGEIGVQDLVISSYSNLLSVNSTSVTVTAYYDPATEYYASTLVGSSVEFDNNSNPIDIDPTNNTVTITYSSGASLDTAFDLVFQGGSLDHFTGITKTSSSGDNANDVTATVSGKTIHIHVGAGGFTNGTIVFTFTSVDASTDTAPTVTGSATNPTYTENGSGVSLFSGVTASTNDSGQTFSGAVFTVSNVADSTEYLRINGVDVALTNGNSLSLGSGYGTASVSRNGSTATVTLSGAVISGANMGTLLSGMTYRNNSENPSVTSRTVTLSQFTDSGSTNNTVSPNLSSQVTVHAVNDAPTDISLTSSSIGQSLGSNGTVGTLSATDVDSNSFTYTLVSGTGSTDNSLFSITGNTLKVNNAATMAPGTYSVRIQVSDGTDTYQKVFSVTVNDDVRPTFDVVPAASNISATGFDLSASLDEAGTIYYVIVADGASAPSVSQIIAGQNASGATAIGSGSHVASSAPYTYSFGITGLNGASSYDVYVVAKDSANNQILSATKVDVTTSPNTAPVFSNLNGGATYTENGSAVVMDNDVTVADTELNNQGNYNGASISIARNGGANNVDTFGNSGLLGGLTQGQNFTYNGLAVGTVTANSSGTLTLTFNSNATSPIVNAVLQSLTYANSSDDPPSSVTLNWTFNDGSLNSSGTNQAVLSITPVNDTPVISNTSVSKTVNEDSAQTFNPADFGFSDVDSGDTLQSITIVTAPTAGELFIDANNDGVRDSGDTLLGNGAVVSAADISKLTFRPTANANGAGYASFTWQVSDGTALSANTGTMTLNVTPVNDAPVISNTSVSKTVNEDSAQTFNPADFGFSDVDSGDTLQSITIVTAPSAGELFIDANNDGVRGVGDTLLGNGAMVSAANISKLTFRPHANANGAGYAAFTWQVSDGTALSTNTGTMTLNVTPVNDAPVISNTSVSKTVNEDSAQTFNPADFGFSDVDSSDTLQSITIVTAPTAGELFIDANNDGVRDSGDTLLGNGAVVSTADISKLTFRPTANANGAGYAAFTWQVSDGTALSANTGTMTLNVTPVNDAPVISNTSVSKTVNEDSAQTFNPADFGFSDVDSSDTLQSITIVTAPAAGELFIDANNDGVRDSGDTLLGNGAVVSAADISKLTFRPTANANGAGYAAFTWQVSDGTALSTNTETMTLNVTPVNDAPVISNTSVSKTVNEDSAQTFNPADFGFSDVDSSDTLQSITIVTAPTAGELFIDANNDGVRDSGDTLLGNGAVVSTADISKLTFRPTANANGAGYASFTWRVSDGTALSANTGTMTLNVTPVNDAPTLSSGDPQFRISDGANGSRPVDSPVPTIQSQVAGTPPLNTWITSSSLGSFNAGHTAGSSSIMASIFTATSDGVSREDATKSDVANIFRHGSSFSSHFESSLGSFPSFSKDPAQGGTSSLASVFSDIYLPSLTPMEVFTGGSWKDITLHAQGATELGPEQATTAFTPSFPRQLQHIGEAEGQRLSAIAQALFEQSQLQG